MYLVYRSGGKPPEDSLGMGIKSSGAKFICRSQAKPLANTYPSTATTSNTPLGTNIGELNWNICAVRLVIHQNEMNALNGTPGQWNVVSAFDCYTTAPWITDHDVVAIIFEICTDTIIDTRTTSTHEFALLNVCSTCCNHWHCSAIVKSTFTSVSNGNVYGCMDALYGCFKHKKNENNSQQHKYGSKVGPISLNKNCWPEIQRCFHSFTKAISARGRGKNPSNKCWNRRQSTLFQQLAFLLMKTPFFLIRKKVQIEKCRKLKYVHNCKIIREIPTWKMV